MILTHASGGRRIYPSDYPYKHNIWWSWPMRQVVGGCTQVIIHTKTTSADLDQCVRWQADIPKWLSIQRQHLLILTRALGGYTQVIIRSKTTSDYPDPCMRWQTDIPKWLSVQRQHLLILTQASGGKRIYRSDYPNKHFFAISKTQRMIACRD